MTTDRGAPWRLPMRGSRRAWILVLFGIFHLGYAASILTINAADIDPGDAILFELLPLWLRATMWAVTGCMAICLAPSRRASVAGWVAVMIMPAERAIGHLSSTVMWIVPGYPPGLAQAPAELAIWLALTGVIWVAAGWPEPDQAHHMIGRADG